MVALRISISAPLERPCESNQLSWLGRARLVNEGEPDPGNDGIFWVGYKVTGPNAGVWHYEYAVYNQNLDRAIQSFEVVFPSQVFRR